MAKQDKPATRAAADGFVLMAADGASVSYNGVDYPVIDGVVEVPTESLAVFIGLGLTTLE